LFLGRRYTDLAITKERKQELVSQYTDLLERSQALILTDFQGLNVTQITRLRSKIRETNGAYYVTKNTLIKLALQQQGLSVPEDWLEGPTAVSFCFDQVPTIAKTITDFAAESELLKIKGAVLGGEPVGEARVKALADLPPAEVLQAQLLGALTAPMSGLIGVLNGLMSGLVGVLESRKDQLGEPEAS
jgi:large subunit ribosomal protein L10